MSWINVIVRGLLCLTFIFLPLHSLDQWFYDHTFPLRGALRSESDIVLVRVSDAKLMQMLEAGKIAHSKGREKLWHTPHTIWYRGFYEPLLAKILKDKPRAVVFTSFFEKVDPPEFSPNSPPKGINGPPALPVIFSSSVDPENKLVPPHQDLGVKESYGFNNIFADQDNMVRSSRLIYLSENSLALRLFHALEESQVPRDLAQPIWIDFRGMAGSYRSWDGWDVFEEPGDGRFANKIVLIGHEGSPASDLETPFEKMSRLEIHANTLESFLQDRGIRFLSRWVNLALSCAAVGISIFLILYFPLKLAWILLLGFAGLVFLLNLLCFSELKIWAGIANPIFSILGTHLLMIGYKLGRQEEKQWRLQQETLFLREVDQFKNNFISLFSHDLKTPIAKIKAVLDRLLTGKNLDNETTEALRSIDKTNRELARLINDILKVTKMESMQIEPRHEVVDLNRLVEDSVQRLKFLADEKGVSIVCDLEPLFSIEGDQQLLREVVINLIENAIKYTPAGSANSRVIVQTREEMKSLRVSVTDEGVGIPDDEIPRVTGKFYRGKQTSQSTKGSGLGLYLAKYFVELHQGRLVIQSAMGKGTTVSFSLPLPQ